MPEWGKWFQQQDEHITQYQSDAQLQRQQIQKMQSMANSTIGDYIKQIAPEAAANFDFGSQLREIYKTSAIPAMQRYMKDAETYDTPERRTQEATRALEGVRKGDEMQERAQIAQLRQAGIDPNDPRYAAARGQNDAEVAALGAVAANDARTGVEERGREMRGQAINVGQGIGTMGQSYSQEGARLGAGVPAAVANQAALGSNLQGQNQGTYTMQSNLTKQLLDTRMQRYQAGVQARAQGGGGMAAGLGGAIGSLAGMGIGAWLGSAAGPMGTLAGAQMGGQMGGQIGGFAQPNRAVY
jgi:hypothetical protein